MAKEYKEGTEKVKNLKWQEAAQLAICASADEELNQGLPRTAPSGGQRGI